MIHEISRYIELFKNPSGISTGCVTHIHRSQTFSTSQWIDTRFYPPRKYSHGQDSNRKDNQEDDTF